jgi:Listeria-Bacteroides repeat domain (List_Bact_rpt)/Chitobiase/beta-hexosaminidase C-terminal domain
MKGSWRPLGLVLVATALAILAGCPLPFEYNGKGATTTPASDPSSPNMTAPVTVSYTDQGGNSGSITDGGLFTSGQTTTVTLSTASLNAVIFYTTDGTALTNLRTAQKITASSGTFTITRTTTAQSLDVHAIAVGPNMLPSPSVHVTVTVSPYPIITVSRASASISEDAGSTTFIITSSVAPVAPLTVNIQASGTYHETLLTGIPVGKGISFTKTIAASTTTATIAIAAQHDQDFLDETITLTVLPDSSTPPTYSVGAPTSASVTIQDDLTPTSTVTYSANGGTGTVPVDTNSYLPNAPVTVAGNPGGLAEVDNEFAGWNTQADGNGTTYTQGQTFAMGTTNVTLYVKWAQRTASFLTQFPPAWSSPRPEAIAFDGASIWVGEVNQSKVYKLNPADGSIIASYSLNATHALSLDGAGGMWTTSYFSPPPVLYHYPLTFGTPDSSITLPLTMSYPTAMTFDSSSNVIWLVNTNATFAYPAHFWKLDAATGTVLDEWDLAGGTPDEAYGLCMDSDPNYLWMVVGSTLSKVSIAGRQVVERYFIPLPTTPNPPLLQGVARVNATTFWLVEGNNKMIFEAQLR